MKAPCKEGDATSYVMLFCVLILVKNSKATMKQAVMLLPPVGNANFLAQELLAQELMGIPAGSR